MNNISINPCPTAAVWLHLFTGIFSTLGRLEYLARCRSARTRRYHHRELVSRFGAERTHSAISAAHTILWNNWLTGSFEQQHADLILYLADHAIDIEEVLRSLEIRGLIGDWAPDSSDDLDREHFQANLSALVGLVRDKCPVNIKADARGSPANGANTVIDKIRCFVEENYSTCNFSLKLIAKKLGLSSRYLGRLFQRHTGQHFRQYLRDVRIQRATSLLIADQRHEVKAIALMVGYKSRSHFDTDFRIRTGFAPAQFRKRSQMHFQSAANA